MVENQSRLELPPECRPLHVPDEGYSTQLSPLATRDLFLAVYGFKLQKVQAMWAAVNGGHSNRLLPSSVCVLQLSSGEEGLHLPLKRP
jgi:hypothetical protein